MGKTTGVRPPLRRLRRHPHRRGKAIERCLSWERAARPPLRHGLRRATSPQGEAFGVRRLPLRGKPAKRRQRREKRAGFEEAARLAGPPRTGNRFAATVRLSAKLTERCPAPAKKKKPLCHRREASLPQIQNIQPEFEKSTIFPQLQCLLNVIIFLAE